MYRQFPYDGYIHESHDANSDSDETSGGEDASLNSMETTDNEDGSNHDNQNTHIVPSPLRRSGVCFSLCFCLI